MYKNYKLRNFFLLIALFLVIVISFIAYAWRRNAPANLYEDNNQTYSSWFGQKGVDESSPFYENEASATLDKDAANRKNAPASVDKNGVNFPERGTQDSLAIPALQENTTGADTTKR